VARNGLDFENKIREREAQNPRFNFLSQTDPYYAYYKGKVGEFESGVTAPPTEPKVKMPDAVREHVQKAEFVPKAPPRAFEFCADPSTLNAFELCVRFLCRDWIFLPLAS
jgi:splicing factor 3A subunit 1